MPPDAPVEADAPGSLPWVASVLVDVGRAPPVLEADELEESPSSLFLQAMSSEPTIPRAIIVVAWLR